MGRLHIIQLMILKIQFVCVCLSCLLTYFLLEMLPSPHCCLRLLFVLLSAQPTRVKLQLDALMQRTRQWSLYLPFSFSLPSLNILNRALADFVLHTPYVCACEHSLHYNSFSEAILRSVSCWHCPAVTLSVATGVPAVGLTPDMNFEFQTTPSHVSPGPHRNPSRAMFTISVAWF